MKRLVARMSRSTHSLLMRYDPPPRALDFDPMVWGIELRIDESVPPGCINLEEEDR